MVDQAFAQDTVMITRTDFFDATGFSRLNWYPVSQNVIKTIAFSKSQEDGSKILETLHQQVLTYHDHKYVNVVYVNLEMMTLAELAEFALWAVELRVGA